MRQTPWRQRPRAPLANGPDQLYVTAVFIVVFLLLGGGAAVLARESVATWLGGALAVLCGAALVRVGVLHLRRPVKR